MGKPDNTAETFRVRQSCGHTTTVVLYGSAEAKAKWVGILQTGECKRCWANKQPPTFYYDEKKWKVSVYHAIPIRETLRARGYRYWCKKWIRDLRNEAETAQELAWIVEQGWECRR